MVPQHPVAILRGIAVLVLTLMFLAGPAAFPSGRVRAYADVSGQDIVNYALSYVGKVPYVWGGNSFSSGMDCSGFVCGVYNHFGINLWSYRTKIRNSPLVTNAGADLSLAVPGDILWFEGHVAIYTGMKNGEHWMVNETKGTYNGITNNVIYSPVRIHKNAFANLRGVLKVQGVNGNNGSSGSGSSGGSTSTVTSGKWTFTVTPYTTDAYLKATYAAGSSGKYTGAGLTIRRRFDSKTIVSENETCNHTLSSPSVWYTLSKDTSAKLDPGVTYEYQFYVIHKGTTYTSPWMTFTTSGSCSHSWIDQGIQEVATALSEGTMICGCTKCGATSSRTIAKLTPTLTLNASTVTLKTGQGFQVVLSGMAEGDYPTQISSSSGYVALVNENGQILANHPGTATVTLTLASGKTGQIRVTVIAAESGSGSSASGSGTGSSGSGSATNGTGPTFTGKVTAVKVTGKSRVAAGKKITLKAAVTVSGAAPTTVKWTSSKASVAKVSASGVVTGKKPGKAVIKATSTDGSKVIGKKTVIVVPKKVTTFKAKALSGRRVKLTWNKPGTLSGYQIQYSRSHKFKKAKTKWVKSSKKTVRVCVPYKKKYYFRIRPYVKIGSKKYYGTWSKKVTARAK